MANKGKKYVGVRKQPFARPELIPCARLSHRVQHQLESVFCHAAAVPALEGEARRLRPRRQR